MTEKTTQNYLGLLLLGTSLAVGLILASFVFVQGAGVFARFDQRITVKGYAEQKIMSNFGEWSGSIVVQAADLTTAYAKLESDLEKTLAFFKEMGIGKDDLELYAVNISSQFKLNAKGNQTNEIDSYVLRQSIGYRSSDVNKVKKVSVESSKLIRYNIVLHSDSPQYTYTNINDLKLNMLSQATKNARERALTLVEGSGNHLGVLRSARQGVFQITSPNSTDVSGYGVYDTSSMEKVVKSVVTIEYTIN